MLKCGGRDGCGLRKIRVSIRDGEGRKGRGRGTLGLGFVERERGWERKGFGKGYGQICQVNG